MNIQIFYKDNPKLIYTKPQIKQFNNIYVQNYTKVSNFNELLSKFPADLHPIIRHEFYKQYNAQKGIQGGILVELTIFATIAKILDIEDFSYQEGQYIYENNKYCLILQGNKGHGSNTNIVGNDIIIIEKDTNSHYNCEIKEPFARCEEMDWNYTEEGKLCESKRPDENKLSLFWPIANAYNKHMSVFQHIGHNYPLTAEMVQDIITDYFGNIDYVLTFTEKDYYLLVLPNNKELFNRIYNYEGSEIRTINGKNLKSIFTPIYAKKILQKYLIKEENEYYYFNPNDLIYTSGRQSSSGRYKMQEGFAIKEKDIVITDGLIKCKKRAFKQNGAVISPKIKLITSYQQIKQNIIEGDY